MSKRQVQNLINEKNMNAQIGEIFRGCYYFDELPDKEFTLRRIITLAKDEIRRIKTVQIIDDL